MFGRPGGIPFDYRPILIKLGLLVGAFIIIYAILWILAEMHLIPYIVFAIFPGIILLIFGIFIFYQAYSKYREFF